MKSPAARAQILNEEGVCPILLQEDIITTGIEQDAGPQLQGVTEAGRGYNSLMFV